jgi:hypothetical protein
MFLTIENSGTWGVILTSNTNEIQKILREFFENLYTNKVENLEEMDKFTAAFGQN